MDGGSEGENDMDMNQSSPMNGSKRPKRKMKTPFQLEVLEKTYAMNMYPSEAIRVGLSEELDLTDRQLQMWFCHRRLKDKREAVGMAAMKPRNPIPAGKRGSKESLREDLMVTEPGNGHGSGSSSRSSSGSGSDSSQFVNGDEIPMVPIRYDKSPEKIMERRVIACVEAQLEEPLREDGPILGIEFDELPPGAFGEPIVPKKQQDRCRQSYDIKLHGECDVEHIKAAASGAPPEAVEFTVKTNAYGLAAHSHLYDSPADGPIAKSSPLMHGNGHLLREYSVEGQVSPRRTDFIKHNEDNLHMERKRKSGEAGTGKEVQAHEKKTHKELEKEDLLRRKREELMQKEMERQDRERRKEDQRIMREQLRQEERLQREERREMERKEKYMQKELLRAERSKQKEDLRKEKEAARQRAAMERATTRRIAKESMELIEDERLELMELAASSKGLPSIVSLDYITLQNLESFRGALCEFPPKSVQLRMPFAVQPWINSEENVGNLLMVWKFCITFADVLGLWPFTIDEFIQAFHDYDSRLLGEIHIASLNLVIKDIEDVVRTPSGGPGTNQYTAVNPEGGHPHIVKEAFFWGFDILSWQNHLNPSTWPEVLRQFALSAGFGPEVKKKGVDPASSNGNDETKGCEDIVSTLRNGSAAENAFAIMQEKGLTQRKSRHRLTPGTVKFAAYHVLALEGSKGLNVIELVEKIQKSGLRDLSSSKTPEASLSVALSRDPILFERIAPCTYNVRPAFRKDPADAESVIASAKEKIEKYANGFLAGQNADEEGKDDDSDSDVAEGAEVDALATPSDTHKIGQCNEVGSCSKGTKDKLVDDSALGNGVGGLGNMDQDVEIDESRSGETWVQGLTDGEYSDLSVEERLNALVALIGVANEGNSIRVILEERMDSANALKKQMLAEAQLDKRRMREEIITKYHDSSFTLSEDPLVVAENKVCDTLEKGGSSVGEDLHNSIDNSTQQNGYTTERSRMLKKSYIGHRAEEMYVYRSLPLGQDRRRNRYWQFVASASSLDPGSDRIFVESPNGYWRLIDSEEAFDALLTSLDTRGSRESHLHIMLQKIEISFKERVKRNKLVPNILDENRNDGTKEASEVNQTFTPVNDESPRSAICHTIYDVQEPSASFRIDLGRNETEKKNFCKRYEDLLMWTWKECFNSSNLYALAHGKKRCLPALGICHTCLDTYDVKEKICLSCHSTKGKLVEQRDLLPEQLNHKINLINATNRNLSNTSPLKIRVIKSLLTLIEVSVPSEALHSSWTEESRITWALKLHSSSSAKDLLQVLIEFERAIKRKYLSADFETTEELLSNCVSSRSEAFGAGSVPQLTWIPKTTAAVALRLLELDASISYTSNQKAEANDEEEALPVEKFNLRYAHTNNVHKAEALEFDRNGLVKKENCDNLRNTPGSSSGYRQAVRGKGGRPRGSSQKGSKSKSSRWSMKKGETTLTEILTQQKGVVRMQQGEKHPRGRRTTVNRRKRTEKGTFMKVVEKKPISCGKVDLVNKSSSRNDAVVENDDDEGGSESSSEECDSDDDSGDKNLYGYQKRGWTTYDVVGPTRRSNERMETSQDDADEIEDQNGEEYLDTEMENYNGHDDSYRDRNGNIDEGIGINDDNSDGDGNRDDDGFAFIDSEEEDYSD